MKIAFYLDLSPISTRYKINWVYDRAEQAQFYCDQRCKVGSKL